MHKKYEQTIYFFEWHVANLNVLDASLPWIEGLRFHWCLINLMPTHSTYGVLTFGTVALYWVWGSERDCKPIMQEPDPL